MKISSPAAGRYVYSQNLSASAYTLPGSNWTFEYLSKWSANSEPVANWKGSDLELPSEAIEYVNGGSGGESCVD
jgi:hypothetical protein